MYWGSGHRVHGGRPGARPDPTPGLVVHGEGVSRCHGPAPDCKQDGRAGRVDEAASYVSPAAGSLRRSFSLIQVSGAPSSENRTRARDCSTRVTVPGQNTVGFPRLAQT